MARSDVKAFYWLRADRERGIWLVMRKVEGWPATVFYETPRQDLAVEILWALAGW